MFYDRKVKYIDYRKEGERIHGAGFIKLEVRDKVCRMQIQVTNMHVTDSASKQVYALSDNREEALCTLELQEGRGSVLLQLERDNLCNGLCYEELKVIRIPMGGGRELYCKVAEAETVEVWKNIMAEAENVAASKSIMEADEKQKRLNCEENVEPLEKKVKVEIEKAEDSKEGTATENETEEDVTEENVTEEGIKAMPTVKFSKWDQLCAIYPHVRPFQDRRDYLRIGPEDFVILDEKSYQQVNNSFLLHGYYNYEHLILTHQKYQGRSRYYVGVPGNFFDREKQVAIMFGFESFECKEEPADTGEFGYYMLPVSL